MDCDIFCFVLFFVIFSIFIICDSDLWEKGHSKEFGSNIIHPKHLGLGAYPPDLYEDATKNRYNDDFKAAMRYGDHYNKMAGLKFGSFDVNQALGYGRHQDEKTDYI